MSKTLIVPDIHERFETMKFIYETYGRQADRIIWLSDFMDSFSGLTDNTHKTIEFLDQIILRDEKSELCLGNHELHYLFDNPKLRCSGYDIKKKKLVKANIPWYKWEPKTHVGILDQGWLISHAGFTEQWLSPYFELGDWLEKIRTTTFLQLEAGLHPEICEYGHTLGGPVHVVGGPFTLNWDHDFRPISNINQIVGHTCHNEPRMKCQSDSLNWCIDVNQTDVVGWIENGEFRIEPVYK